MGNATARNLAVKFVLARASALRPIVGNRDNFVAIGWTAKAPSVHVVALKVLSVEWQIMHAIAGMHRGVQRMKVMVFCGCGGYWDR